MGLQKKILPPIIPDPEDDLEDISSPTACFPEGGDSFVFEGITMQPFYHDQQGCVVWHEGSDGKVYFTSGLGIALCADSRAEFVTRVRIECSLYHKLHHLYPRDFVVLLNGRKGIEGCIDLNWLEENKSNLTIIMILSKIFICINLHISSINSRDKNPRHSLAISIPVLAIFVGTSFHISVDSMNQVRQKEEKVKVGNEGSKSATESPNQCHRQIGGIMYFTRNAPPSINQKTRTSFSSHIFRVLQCPPR